MAYKYFRINVIIRIVLLMLAGYSIIYVLTQTHFWLVAFWIMLFVVILTIELIHYVERSHKDLSNFLLSIRQSDFATVYPAVNGKRSQDGLKQAYHEILKVFQRLRSEKEFQHQYLQTVVEHVRVALVCFDEQEEIQLINEAAKNLFNKPYLKNIQSLGQLSPKLLEAIRQLEIGKKELIKLELNGSLVNLSLQATTFKMGQKSYKLVSFQDIRNELEAQEVESWQKLIRVLTHEIMNSVIPIATLTSVINEMLHEHEEKHHSLSHLDDEDALDIRTSLTTIENRSKGLISFVKSYSSLTQTAKPVFAQVPVDQLFSRVYTLLRPGIEKKHIKFNLILLQENLFIQADAELIEQVLINLVLNAIDAVESRESPTIELIAGKLPSNQILLQVKDNGIGMDQEVQQHIFVPFYTTKKKGSGIGLSLAKQIMLLHKGNINVHSVPGEGSNFRLYF